jgi:metallophosphoesterase (TIGR00282 family)
MPIHLLCLGDVVGKPGRQVVGELLPKLLTERSIDAVICNAENAAAGSGLTPPIFQKLRAMGIDCCTLGDHTFRKREVLPLLEQSDRLIRPGNFPAEATGRGWTVITSRSGVKVGVLQAMGRINMGLQMDDPFKCVDRMLGEIPKDVKVRVLDFHAETSSEKMAMGWHIDGRVSVCFGTHTHTPTADQRVLPGGTAFVSDLGMTGPYDSILGRRKDRVLKHMLTGMPHYFEVATGDPRLGAVIVRVDELSGLALSIERCDLKGTEQAGAYDQDDGKSQPFAEM